jgi:outer membrane protein assembly factor BamB
MKRSLLLAVVAVLVLSAGCRNKAPRRPTRPAGPDSVAFGDTATYTSVTTDPNRDRIAYIFDWRDGDTTVTALTRTAEAVTASHLWQALGIYYIRVRARDERGLYSAEWSDSLRVRVYYDSAHPPVNHPPNAPDTPQVTGPRYRDSLLTVTTAATDPDDDSVTILISFGDPGVSDWQSPETPSGGAVTTTVRYPSAGQKTITAIAIDARGDTSDPTGIVISITAPGGNHAPMQPRFEAVPSRGVINGPAYRFYASAFDPDGDTLRYHYRFGADTATTGWYTSGFSACGYWMPADTGAWTISVVAEDPSGARSTAAETTFQVVPEGQLLWSISGEFVASPAIGTMPNRGATRTALVIGAKSYGGEDDAVVFIDCHMGPTEREILDRSVLGGDIESFSSSPAISSTGTVYTGNDNGTLFAISPGCSVKWFYPDTATGLDLSTTPAIDGSAIYVAGDDRKLSKFTDNGPTYTLQWQRDLHYEATASPAVDADGNVIACDDSGYVYKYSSTGALVWELATGQYLGITASPAIVADGTAYIATEAGDLLAVKDHAILWSYHVDSAGITASPVIGTDAHVYVAADNGRLYNIDPNTHTVEPGWPRQISTYSFSATPFVFQNGFYLIDDDECLFALDLLGNVRWSLQLPTPPRTSFSEQPSPVVDQYGIIYVATQSGLFAIAGPSQNGAIANTAWPCFHHDARHSGKYGAR